MVWPSFRHSAAAYWIGLVGIILIPLLPEAYLAKVGTSDPKSVASPLYYELIFGFLCLLPAVLLPRAVARIWAFAVALVFCLATLIVAFQAFTVRSRWDGTAHAALLQTTPGEAIGFVRGFATPGIFLSEGAVLAAFIASLWLFIRQDAPMLRLRVWVAIGGLAVSSLGLANFLRYGRHVVNPVILHDGTMVRIATLGVNLRHPVLQLELTQFNFAQTHAYYLERFREAATDPEVQTPPSLRSPAALPRFVLILIGESASRRHWSLYGYPRETTPRLETMRRELAVFTDVISPSVGTSTVLRRMFSTESRGIPFFPVLNHAGFKTHWLSAQYSQGENDVEIAALISSCGDRRFLNGSFDGNLSPWIDGLLAEPGNHVVFVNLFGSHVRYSDRYPESMAVFHGRTDKDKIVAEYDNSIHYTDFVLAETIVRMKRLNLPTCLLYVSDHAEDVYDSDASRYLFRNEAIATNAMYEVPFFVWCSPEYEHGNPELVASIRTAANQPYQPIALYEEVMDLARVNSPVYHPKDALFSPQYEPKVRKVGVYGRTYRPDAGSMMSEGTKSSRTP